MNCPKCSAVNDEKNRFCFSCGASLEQNAGNEAHSAQDYADAERRAQELATINARTLIAAKEARAVDIRNMRPITRMAYNIVESERGMLLSLLVAMLYGISGLGLVATLIKIFDVVELLSQSLISSNVGSSISEIIAQSRGDNLQDLAWLVALFVALAVVFIMLGKLNIRIGKVNRKKKRENLDARL